MPPFFAMMIFKTSRFQFKTLESSETIYKQMSGKLTNGFIKKLFVL